MELGSHMRAEPSTADSIEPVGPSSFHLRVGVLLVLLWMLPFWALAPSIAHALRGLSSPPSVAAVTTTIIVVQTLLGLIGLWVAGTQVKPIVKGTTKGQAIRALWSILLHGNIRDQADHGDRQT
jgi:hypothetical protein